MCFFTAPSNPYLSMIRLLVSIPQMLVISNIPIPVFDAKKANPVTNVPPIIPPSHDHQGRLQENILGILILSLGIMITNSNNIIVAVIKETKAA